MKRILTLMLCLLLLMPTAMAQSKRPTTRKSTTTTARKTTGKSTGKSTGKTTAKTTAKTTGTASGSAFVPKAPRLFEGTLMYASQEYHSKAIMRYSYGQAYCGTREMSVTVSGNKLHIIDETIQLHTIFDADANKVYVYSELTRTGISRNYTEYAAQFSTLSGQSRFNQVEWRQPGQTNYKGDVLQTYHADITPRTPETNSTGSIEIWSSKAFKVGDIMKNFCYGADPHGLLKKWMWEIKGSAPILGTLHSIVLAELVAVSEYSVEPEVFQVPSDVTIVPDDQTCRKTVKFYKAHRKAMKKNHINPSEDVDSMLAQIRHDWSFVQELEDNENESGNLGLTLWSEVGRSVISAAAELTREQIELRRQERLERELLRQQQAAQEAQEAQEAATATAMASGKRMQRGAGGKMVAATTSSKGNARTTPAKGTARPTASGKGNTLNTRRVMAEVRSRASSSNIALAMKNYQERLEEKVMQKFGYKCYVQPGTQYDKRLHILCGECHGTPGRACKFCNGMGFYKKIYEEMVTPDGVVDYGTSDVPMKGTRRDCGVCGGNGVCKICHGSGKGVATVMGSDVKKSCDICHGSKKCKTCDGKGYKTIYRPDPSGECTTEDESTQTGRSSVEREMDCAQCGGSGICTHCKGTKLIHSFGETTDCSMCRKTGKCFVCNGKKKTTYIARE